MKLCYRYEGEDKEGCQEHRQNQRAEGDAGATRHLSCGLYSWKAGIPHTACSLK